MKLPLKLRLLVVARSVAHVLRRPVYLGLALLATFVTFQLLVWFFNFNLLFFLEFQTQLPLISKLMFPLASFVTLFTNLSSLQAVTLLVLSVTQGILITVLVYIFRRRRFSTAAAGTGGLSLVVGLMGFGCTTCGTSLLSPILSGLAAGSAAAVGAILGPLVNLASIGLAIAALIKIAGPLSNELAVEKQNNIVEGGKDV